MPQVNFTLEEMLQIKAGNESDDLKAKLNEAENLVKFTALRESVKSTVDTAAVSLIHDTLRPLTIPAGIKEIALIYDLSLETFDFNVRSTGVKVEYQSEGAVSDEITLLVTKAEAAKDNRPLSFIVGALGEGRVGHIKAMRDFADTKKTLDALYTGVNANKLSKGVSELPQGDKCRLQIKYRFDLETDSDGNHTPGWLAPYVTVGKTVSSGGGGGGQGFRVTAPDGFKSWTEYGRTGDEQAQNLYKGAVEKYGQDFQKKQSFSNILKTAKHPVYLQRSEEAKTKRDKLTEGSN